MRHKPQKLFLLVNDQGEPYREGGEVKAYNSSGKAIQKAKKLYHSRAVLFSVLRAKLAHRTNVGAPDAPRSVE
jgi:hypothetical protein